LAREKRELAREKRELAREKRERASVSGPDRKRPECTSFPKRRTLV